jgi:phosphoserine aminotransferase
MLNYGLMVDKDSLFNTPNTFGYYALDQMFSWLQDLGGVSAIHEINKKKSGLLYDTLDRSDFWRPHAEKDARSDMNVTFKIHDPALEPIFLQKALESGLHGLKGHRSVGGLRASIYNACPLSSVEALVAFMRDFEQQHG